MHILTLLFRLEYIENHVILMAGNHLISQEFPFRYALYGLIVVSIVYLIVRTETRSLIAARRLLKEKDNALLQVAEQKGRLEMREKEITDSLIYAQRIQEALLPAESFFRKFLKDSFVFYKPKDIVSGDFYWIGEKGGKIFIAAADCTGHGVPGAIMSMIGLEIIEKTIMDERIEVPSKILSVLDKGLEKTFSRAKNIGTIIRDGMDIGLCVIDRSNRKVHFSGAFFPLYLIRNNSLTEIKGDKIIIGMNPEELKYTDHVIDLEEDDVLYLFSDGYVDQFGGGEMKKFMYRRFRYLLLTIHSFPAEDQKSILDENLKSWMGDAGQVDDIMVLGFKPLSNTR